MSLESMGEVVALPAIRSFPWSTGVVWVVLVLATLSDLRTRRIPNGLTGGACLTGLIVVALTDGIAPAGGHLLWAFLVVAVGLVIPKRLLGMGDAKLWAAVAASEGPAVTALLVLMTSLSVAVMQGAQFTLALARTLPVRRRPVVPPHVPMAPYALASWCLFCLGAALGPVVLRARGLA